MTFFDMLEKQDVATVYVSGCINSLLIAHHSDIATHLLVRMYILGMTLSVYRSLAKKGPWAVHITLCSDKGMGGYL